MSKDNSKGASKKVNCNHQNALPYFGPVYSCPDCGALPIKDICKPGKQWRKNGQRNYIYKNE